MQWLFPAFLAGAAAIALPIALHLLRRWPKRTVVFPSLRFFAPTMQQNDRSQRLKRWCVLLLRCAAFVLLAAAFARPFFSRGDASPRRAFVLLLDNSFSMQAPERWERSLAWAREKMGSTSRGDTIGLLAVCPTPTWIVPVNTPAETALERLRTLAPGWGTGRIEPALRLAAATLAATPANQRELILVGDHQRVGWSGFEFGRKAPPGVVLTFPEPAAAPRLQAALSDAVLARTASGLRLTVSVRNFSVAHARTLRVFRDGNSQPLVEQKLSLGERDAQVITCDLAEPQAEVVSVRCALDRDDIPADDEAFAVWRSGGERNVLVDAVPVGAQADFVGTALMAGTGKSGFHVAPLSSAAWPAGTVVVVRSDSSFGGEAARRLDAFVRSGGAALVFVRSSAGAAWVSHALKTNVHPLPTTTPRLELRDWTMEHPLIAGTSRYSADALLGWRFRHGWAIPADVGEPLALWPQEAAAISEVTLGEGKLLICGFDPDRRETEWPVQESFVPFLHRAATYLSNLPSAGAMKPLVVDERIDLPETSGQWRALSGPSSRQVMEITAGSVVPSLPGVYEFSAASSRRVFAVNVPVAESDPEAWSEGAPWRRLASAGTGAGAVARNQIPLAAKEAEQRSGGWWWPLAGMGFLMLFELGVANQTSR